MEVSNVVSRIASASNIDAGIPSDEANIMQTSPYNEYPLTIPFYIVKLGFTGVYIIF